VTVLGCGIIGLMTGLECVKRGFKVRIIAERIPQIVENMG
jgi:glycine/D-amino acid oxidase-like deaminating enzyme